VKEEISEVWFYGTELFSNTVLVMLTSSTLLMYIAAPHQPLRFLKKEFFTTIYDFLM
jgi:hypothetical protein